MYILGIIGKPGSECHDSSAALIKDGLVVAAAEQERFSRRKHAPGEAPLDAIAYCLDKEGISVDDVDYVAVSWEPEGIHGEVKGKHKEELLEKILPTNIFKYNAKRIRCGYVNHHITHITAAFYQSGFSDAACMVIDGQGENEAITLAKVSKGNLEVIKKFPIAYSLGALYDAAAGYVGLGFDVPGKFMGLASYGIPNQKMPISFDCDEGKFLIKSDYFNEKNNFYETRENYIKYFEKNNYPYRRASIGEIQASELMTYSNFAASVQNSLDEMFINMAKYLKSIVNTQNLILAGGVALNCTANGKLDRSKIFDNIFVYPASNDAGCSVGAALEIARQRGIFDKNTSRRIQNVYLGKSYANDDVLVSIKNSRLKVKYMEDSLLTKTIAKDLNENKIIGWFQSGFEFGPRALGARSLLAGTVDRNITNRLNRVKGRELWRPLSPIILDKCYSDVFEDDTPQNMSSFMLKTCIVREEWRSKVPAIVHVDDSSRPQYLCQEDNELLYGLLQEYYDLTSIPMIVNTSFNTHGRPIVNSPREALIEFEKEKGIDILVIGNYYIER